MLRRLVLVFVSFVLMLNGFSMIGTYEHYYSFTSPYLLAIGKAGLAIDNLGIESFLFNPANGSQKFSMEIVGISAVLNSTSLDIILDIINDITTSGISLDKIIDLVGKPVYPNLRFGILGFSIPTGPFYLNFGIVSASLNIYFEFHHPLSTAGLIDFLALGFISPYIGFSLPFDKFSSGNSDVDKYLFSRLVAGLNFRFSFYVGVAENITLGELVSGYQPNFSVFTNVSFRVIPDLGFLYKIPLDGDNGKEERLNIALAVKDIGGVPAKSIYGSEFVFIPTTFNIGVSYFIDLYKYLEINRVLRENYVSLDFHDIFFQRKDKDFFKRLHIGISSKIYDLDNLVSFNLGIGINGGYPTFGFNVKLVAIKLGFSVYTEELGVYAGQDPDTRYVFSVSIGW